MIIQFRKRMSRQEDEFESKDASNCNALTSISQARVSWKETKRQDDTNAFIQPWDAFLRPDGCKCMTKVERSKAVMSCLEA